MADAANATLPGGANSPLQIQSKTQYVPGLLVDEQNLLPDAESDRNALAELFAGIIGAYNADMQDAPIGITFSGMTMSVAQFGQRVFVQGRLADYTPTVQFPIATADPTQGRYDSLFVQYAPIATAARMQLVEDDSGNETQEQIYNNQESVNWTVMTGTPGQPAVTTLANYELYALIYVAPGSTAPIVAARLFETAQARILANAVISINGLQGIINIIGGSGVSVGTDIHGNITLSSTQVAGVTTINAKTGEVTVTGGPAIGITPTANGFEIDNTLILAGGSGISVQKSSDGTTWTITNTGGSTSVNGATGNVVLGSASGTVGVSVSGDSISLDVVAHGIGTSLGTTIAFSSITGGSNITASLALPGPAGTGYFIEAYATGFDFTSSGGTATLVGSGGSWGGQAKTGYTYSERSLYIAGTAAGGETIGVALEPTSPIGMRGSTTGFVTIKATRIS